VKFEIVKLKQFSGKRLIVYSVIIEDEQQTLFDRFLQENISGYREELGEIRNRLLTMKDKTGIQAKRSCKATSFLTMMTQWTFNNFLL